MLKLKYNGRTFTNGRSLANAMKSDFNREIERKVRRAASASASGVHVRKTHNGFEIEGEADKMTRFNNRIGQ